MQVLPIDEHPQLESMLWKIDDLWPVFMQQDPISNLYYNRVTDDFAEFAMVAIDEDAPEHPIARSFAVPFVFGDEVGRPVLPDDGWDGVVRWGWYDRVLGRSPNAVSALEIAIRPDKRGSGIAPVMLAAMRDNVKRLGFSDLYAPVRPSQKTLEPNTPMSEYAWRTREDGLPHDPWLRVHARAGGKLLSICPRAMTIAGSLAEWRDWTGLAFDTTGDIEVPGALNPVHCSVEHDHVVYTEPGVWVHHRID